jgi:uncharacterized protein (TIGR02599 family)
MRLPVSLLDLTRKKAGAFTLLEVLVACGILVLLLSMVLSVINVTSRLWKDTTNKMQAFGEARLAFSQIGQKLNLAVLNPYWDYDTLPNPTTYERYSELQFLSARMSDVGSAYSADYCPTCGIFFQAPTGITANKASYGNMPGLLNVYGYFIQFESDASDRPSFLPSIAASRNRYRYRLKEWQLPAENFTLYTESATTTGKTFLGAATLEWINFTDVTPRTIADNVIALAILPKTASSATSAGVAMTNNYFYNSRTDGSSALELAQKHQLPPEVEIVLVAIDEVSAMRTQGSSTTPPVLVDPLLFKDAQRFEEDIQTLQKNLDARKIRYIVLRSTVLIRAARWSK